MDSMFRRLPARRLHGIVHRGGGGTFSFLHISFQARGVSCSPQMRSASEKKQNGAHFVRYRLHCY